MTRSPNLRSSWNIAPTQDAGVIVPEEGGLIYKPMRWGLVPMWAKDIKIGNQAINARETETLAGNSADLKERTLGVEVFGRPPDYDTNADPVVRFTAGEVRKRLAQYYQEEGDTSPLRVGIPLGSYAAELRLREVSHRAEAVAAGTLSAQKDAAQTAVDGPPRARFAFRQQLAPIRAFGFLRRGRQSWLYCLGW